MSYKYVISECRKVCNAKVRLNMHAEAEWYETDYMQHNFIIYINFE